MISTQNNVSEATDILKINTTAKYRNTKGYSHRSTDNQSRTAVLLTRNTDYRRTNTYVKRIANASSKHHLDAHASAPCLDFALAEVLCKNVGGILFTSDFTEARSSATYCFLQPKVFDLEMPHPPEASAGRKTLGCRRIGSDHDVSGQPHLPQYTL